MYRQKIECATGHVNPLVKTVEALCTNPEYDKWANHPAATILVRLSSASISSAYARPRWIPGRRLPCQGDVVELTIALAHEEHVVLRAVVAVHVVDDPSAGQTRQIGFGRIVRHSFAPFPHDVRAYPGQTLRHTHMHRTGRKTIIRTPETERNATATRHRRRRKGPVRGKDPPHPRATAWEDRPSTGPA